MTGKAMMRLVVWAAGMVSVFSLLSQQQVPHLEFEIELHAIHEGKGTMVVAVYDHTDNFLTDDAFMKLYLPVAQSGQMRIPVTALPQGTYALAIFHDVDDDGVLDKNWLGIPSEPIGFSNDARGRLGPPKFIDAAFFLDRHHQSVKITLY